MTMAQEPESQFDPETYLAHYYDDPHPDDDLVLRLTCRALKDAQPAGELDIVDVGTGPNLYPLLAALPRARSLTAWDYARPNTEWLKNELARDAMRLQWQHFWAVAREAWGGGPELPEDPIPELRRKTVPHQGSIYDLPKRNWDAASMFFCAEAVTNVQSEFDEACACFARSVRPGGTLVAGFLLNSASYELDGVRSPIMTLSEDSLQATFRKAARNVTTRPIGIVKEEVRSGYTGMVLLSAVAA
jgi:hypothetical protein